VCKETVSCPEHGFLFPSEADDSDGTKRCRKCGSTVVVGRIEKMSKSKKNVIDPNLMIDKYGADTTRLFCLFAAPPERDLEWSEQGVEGAFRFLNRVWRLAASWAGDLQGIPAFSEGPTSVSSRSAGFQALYRKIHQTIQKVTGDIEDRFHFNTAISAIMELVNLMQTFPRGKDTAEDQENDVSLMRFALETVVLLLSPIVPHFSEELWAELGHGTSVMTAAWPGFIEDALVKESLLIVVQVNGKLRSRFNVSADADDETIKTMALADERVQSFVGGKHIKKVIVVKKKLVNVVV